LTVLDPRPMLALPVMHESKRNKLERKLRACGLASLDMHEAGAAAEALDAVGGVPESEALVRALETAIVVTYARPFSKSNLHRFKKGDYRPVDLTLAAAHDTLILLRDKVYAQIDPEAGREFTIDVLEDELVDHDAAAHRTRVEWKTHWAPLVARVELPLILALCQLQAVRFAQEAVGQKLKLHRSS
jgi:hypothetical protein